MTSTRRVFAAAAVLASLHASSAQAAPLAEGDLTFSKPSATSLRVCASGRITGGAYVAGAWTFTITGVRADGSTWTHVPLPVQAPTLASTCAVLGTAGQNGAGWALLTFTGATTGGDVATACFAALTHSPSSFPHPLVWGCSNPALLDRSTA